MEWFPSVDPTLPKVYERVWSGGRDVTTEPVQTWPWPWSRYYREGQRPRLYPGEVVEWPDPATLAPIEITRTRAGRGTRGRV